MEYVQQWTNAFPFFGARARVANSTGKGQVGKLKKVEFGFRSGISDVDERILFANWHLEKDQPDEGPRWLWTIAGNTKLSWV